MREIYSLTPETKEVFSDNVKRIALEMDVSDKYLYAILNEERTDCFAPFKRQYAASVRAGADVSPWDMALCQIKARYTRDTRSDVECLTQKITRDADTTAKLVDALKDGAIDEKESLAIRKAIQKERDSLDVLEAMLGVKPAGVKQFRAEGGR